MGNSIFSEMIDKWPSSIVSRQEIGNFSGGLLNPRTVANLDSLGRGPGGRFSLGRKVAYPVVEVVRFLEKNMTQVSAKRACTHDTFTGS